MPDCTPADDPANGGATFAADSATGRWTFAGALNQYRNETIEYKPLRANPGDTEVTVRTAVIKPAGSPVQIDYSMEKKADGWKAYDVIVGGVSLVTNYRDEFNEQIKAGGIDGLLKTLADKNKGTAAK